MLLNLSYGYAAKKEQIDAEVGKAFDLSQRKELNGVTYANLQISAGSMDIYNLLVLNERPNLCTLEMRPKGIVISFQSNSETFAFVIPHYKLRIYKGKAQEYSFYRDQNFIKIFANEEPRIHAFVKKIRKYRSDHAPTRVEDLL